MNGSASGSVCCSNYMEGCTWVGELKDLHDHLGGCQVRVACPLGCNKCLYRSELKEHCSYHCHKRMILCKNCGYYNTFTTITEKHYPICSWSPIDCPNQCLVKRLQQQQLEQHLKECSHQIIDCPCRKTPTGCSVRLPRRKMILHILNQHNLMVKINQTVAIIPPTVSPQYLHNQAPMEFIINNFNEKKEANEELFSSPFYTYNRGYKFCLQVYTNGYSKSRGSYLSVFAKLMRGEYDNKLEWPFEGDIRVELLNWRADKDHHSHTISFDRYHDPDGISTSRLTNQETAIGYGSAQFISHTDLAPTTNTEYLRDDYLKLRVSAIVYYSTPLLHWYMTPAWQDSLSTAQSGTAQFTVTECSKRKQFNNQYISPPFTTSPQGYRLCLRVDTNGRGCGKGSHLSIFAYIMKGQHDDHLQWPFTGTISFELLNWLEDKEHYKRTLVLTDFVRVTKRKYGNFTGYPQFISQSSLNSSTNPLFLYQDCICVRVQAIANN